MFSGWKLSEVKTDNKKHAELIKILGTWRFNAGAYVADNKGDQLIKEAEYLRENFGDLTNWELELIVRLYGNRTLRVTDMNHVNFSPVFMAQVIGAYQDYKAVVLRPVLEEIRKLPPPPEKITPEMNADAMKWMVEQVYEICDKGLRIMLNYGLINSVWRYFDEHAIIKVTATQEKKALQFAKSVSKVPDAEVKEQIGLGAKLAGDPGSPEYESRRKDILFKVYLLTDFFKKHPLKEVLKKVKV